MTVTNKILCVTQCSCETDKAWVICHMWLLFTMKKLVHGISFP